MPWSHVKAEQSSDTQYPHVGPCGWIPGYHAARRNKRNLVILWVKAHRLTCEEKKKNLFSSEMFMRSLGREIHHCGESNLCPTRDSDWHLPSCKETFLTLVHWIHQPLHRPLFIWAENCSCLFCLWADDYKLLSEMISISGVKRGLRVTQSSEQTTSSNRENILYYVQHCCCFSMRGLFLTYYVICDIFMHEAGWKTSPVQHTFT